MTKYSFNELTVLIITKDRPYCLKRNLRHWSTTNANLIVLDGSKETQKHKLPSYGNKVSYFHMPVSVEQRLFYASTIVDSTYTIIVADDDLIVFSGLQSCINKLEEDSELVASIGTALGFKLISSRVKTFEVYNDLLKFGFINYDSPFQRIRYRANNYECTTFYSIIRTPIFNKAASVFKDSPSLDGNLMELIFEFCITYLGKSLVVDKLFWLRSREYLSGWRSTEPYGTWTFALKHEARKKIYKNFKFNFLYNDSFMKRYLGIFQLSLFILKIQLNGLKTRFKLNKLSTFIIIPIIVVYVNLNIENQNKIKKVKFHCTSKLKKIKLINFFFNNPINLNEDINNGLGNLSKTFDQEIKEIFVEIEDFH